MTSGNRQSAETPDEALHDPIGAFRLMSGWRLLWLRYSPTPKARRLRAGINEWAQQQTDLGMDPR